MAKKSRVKAITGRDENFAQWYTDVCRKAELMDYTKAKGFIIYRPLGYAIWEAMQRFLDKRFKASGHDNVYFPLVIPESLFLKEAEHVEGFAPETAVITEGGNEKLAERLIVRPTSEVLFSEHYSKVISSYRDLPKKYNQWCSVVRWEKTTRPFLRGSEFLWQEGHTVHATKEEAEEEALDILKDYDELGSELLAIPFIKGIKTEKEKFAGAEKTYAVESLMHDKKALQSGTTHYLGTGFAEAFDIRFQDKDKQLKPVYQTSWGASTRLIGALIMVHGDDSGLVLPPRVAPTQVQIVPIAQNKEGVMEAVLSLKDQLIKAGVRTDIDDSDKTPGWKFAESEMKGIPIRIEIGPRDLEKASCVVVKRFNHDKTSYPLNDVPGVIPGMLDDIHHAMYEKANQELKANTHDAKTYAEFKALIEDKGGFVNMMWCGDPACEAKIKDDTTATSRVIPFDQHTISDTCPVCHKKAKYLVTYAKAY